MKVDFKYLEYSKEEDTFHINQTHLFNHKEIEKIKTVTLASGFESGDVIYKNSVFQSFRLNPANFNKYCKNILIKDKKIVSGASSPDKSTLFPMLSGSGLLPFVNFVQDCDITDKELLFNRIPTSGECWSNNKTINIDHVDYPLFSIGELLGMNDDFIYTLGAIPPNCDVVSGLLRGISIDYKAPFSVYELATILQSKYSPRLMYDNVFYSSIRNKKVKMDYNSYSFLLSIKKNNTVLFNSLLDEYDIKALDKNTYNNALDYMYYCLVSTHVHTNDKLFFGDYVLRNNADFVNCVQLLRNRKDFSALEELTKFINNNLIVDNSSFDIGIELVVSKRVDLKVPGIFEVDYYSIPENINPETDYSEIPF